MSSKDSSRDSERRRISILGVTGSIGRSALEVVRQHGDRFELQAVSAGYNIEGLIGIIEEFRPKFAALASVGSGDGEQKWRRLEEVAKSCGTSVAVGEDAVCDAARYPTELVIAAIVGIAGLRPTLESIGQGYDIALANKECLVSAGDLVRSSCRESGSKLLPVDSEHNAIFQVLEEHNLQHLEKITLTASGGPFLNTPKDKMGDITPQQAVAHPNWRMGAKISVDSATMMNKGLEVIEASYLFELCDDRIDVVIHPESIVHSAVHYDDGSILAQMGMPNMQTPISYCMTYPERISLDIPRLSLVDIGRLHFYEPDYDRFPCLELARDALRAGGCSTTVLNAANEVAVARFLGGDIGFTDIARLVAAALDRFDGCRGIDSLDDVLQLDNEVRLYVESTLLSV